MTVYEKPHGLVQNAIAVTLYCDYAFAGLHMSSAPRASSKTSEISSPDGDVCYKSPTTVSESSLNRVIPHLHFYLCRVQYMHFTQVELELSI